MRKLLAVFLFYVLFTSHAAAETWSFAVVGDTQGPDSSAPVSPVSPVLDKIIKEINVSKPDFVIQMGDKVSGSHKPDVLKEQFLVYRQKTAALIPPLYEVPGNHDLPGKKSYPVYQEVIASQRYYSFDHKGCHFVILSTEEKTGLRGGLGEEQLSWLEDDLEKNAESTGRGRSPSPTFIFMHRPLYQGVIHPYGLSDSGELGEILRRHGIEYVFAGHEHRFGIIRRGGITEYITGGGGAPLLNFTEESGGFYHFLMVKVADGKLDVKPVKIDYPKTYQDLGNLLKSYQNLQTAD